MFVRISELQGRRGLYKNSMGSLLPFKIFDEQLSHTTLLHALTDHRQRDRKTTTLRGLCERR